MRFYKILSILTSILLVFLFVQMFFNSGEFMVQLGLQPSESLVIICRRTSIFMIGLSMLTFSVRNLESNKTRQQICFSIAVIMLGLACLGSYEYMKGTLSSSIITAISIETSIGVAFMGIFLKNFRFSF